MGKVASVAVSAGGGLGAAMMAAAATKPEDAVSNLSGWAKLLHLDSIANLVSNPGADTIAFITGAIMLIGAAAWWVLRGADKRLEKRLEAEELARLRAHGRAREKYEKEVLEVPTTKEDIQMGDSYQNNGTVNGNFGPTTNIYGKPPFQMSEAVLAEVAAKIGPARAIGLHWVGSQRSYTDAETLARYLEHKGFAVHRKGGIGMLIPQLSKPIELRGSDLYVDSDK